MDNVDYIKSLYAAFMSGKIDMLVSEMDPKIDWFSNADPALLPWGGEHHGPKEARHFFDELTAHVDFESFTPMEFFSGNDFVVVRGHSAGRMKPSGGHIEDEWIHLFKLRNGKVTAFRSYSNTHAAVQAYFGGDIHAAGLPSDRHETPRHH